MVAAGIGGKDNDMRIIKEGNMNPKGEENEMFKMRLCVYMSF